MLFTQERLSFSGFHQIAFVPVVLLSHCVIRSHMAKPRPDTEAKLESPSRMVPETPGLPASISDVKWEFMDLLDLDSTGQVGRHTL